MKWLRSPAGIVMLIVIGVILASVLWSTLGRSAESKAINDCERTAGFLKADPDEATFTTISWSHEVPGGWEVKGQHREPRQERIIRFWECSTASGEARITWWSKAA